MPVNKGFNGTTIQFAYTTYAWTGAELTIDGEKVDVTDINQVQMLFQSGLPNWSLSLDIKGSAAPAQGATGSLSLSWKDTGAVSFPGTLFLILSVRVGGKINQPIDSTITVVPTPSS